MTDTRTPYPATIGGREIYVLEATETQIAFMGRFQKRAQKAMDNGDAVAAVYSIADILDVLDSLIVNDEDREFLAGKMMVGELGAEDFVNAWREALPTGEKAPATGPKPRVTRGKASAK
jgi:hypothetical protein